MLDSNFASILDIKEPLLIIRKEQMDALDDHARKSFADRLINYLRERQGVWVANSPDAELRQRVNWGIARARSHGFQWESSIMKFVALMFRIAPNFDEYPPIEALLARKDVPLEQRADLLFTEITPEQWQAASERYDSAAWEFAE
jgi:hypothetical protein